MKSLNWASCALIALMFAVSTPALAAEPASPLVRERVPTLPSVTPEQDILNPQTAGGQITSTGDPDVNAVLAAERDIRAKGIAAVKDHEASLRAVLEQMPQPFERVIKVNGQVAAYRADSMSDCIAFLARTVASPQNGERKFDCRGNPYPTAALYLGSYFNEFGRPSEALQALDAGLLAAPEFPGLISERGATLVLLHRWPEALANADRGLAVANLQDHDRARLYRARGYALTELWRLDEAIEAYRESLKLTPRNPLAEHEISYIKSLQRGRPPQSSGITSVLPKGKQGGQ